MKAIIKVARTGKKSSQECDKQVREVEGKINKAYINKGRRSILTENNDELVDAGNDGSKQFLPFNHIRKANQNIDADLSLPEFVEIFNFLNSKLKAVKNRHTYKDME
ncbi:5223_t:CDS:2 [Diversispora eburnea]|uniref:5223_t:CDS:1 n=1 Tax=Diversispora eburnea TaxID=1213867 RepID=A0A9N8WEG9_9GLOM|nr:5223_t:CDS:2 [Diversispora eburnea]